MINKQRISTRDTICRHTMVPSSTYKRRALAPENAKSWSLLEKGRRVRSKCWPLFIRLICLLKKYSDSAYRMRLHATFEASNYSQGNSGADIDFTSDRAPELYMAQLSCLHLFERQGRRSSDIRVSLLSFCFPLMLM